MKRVCVAFGTRPEATKMAPVIFALEKREGLEPVLLVSGQHRAQLDQVLNLFKLKPDADLDVMQQRQTLPDLLGRIVPTAAKKLSALKLDYVLVHGDTLTTFAVALAAFYEGIPVAHVEAGLRTYDMAQPFPEEANRRLTDVLTDIDLPPTPWAKGNLLKEGKLEATTIVTGNTAVDAVAYASKLAKLPAHLPKDKLIGVTMHRRENLAVMRPLAQALAEVARAHPDFTFVYPVHLNPAVREAVWEPLSGLANVRLEEPYDFLSALALWRNSELIITDSGGIQEEGAALGVPVVVLRNVTERPEGVKVGTLKLAGNDPEDVRRLLTDLLANSDKRRAMRDKPNPYGDGKAGQRVAQATAWRLGLAERPQDWEPEVSD